jgi:4a-hydroxytetrahydrobiopterin dehydratase
MTSSLRAGSAQANEKLALPFANSYTKRVFCVMIGCKVQEFMTKLSISEIEEGLKALPGWSIQNGNLTKQFELSSFPDLVSFIVKIGFIAEAANHHPDLLINYRRLTFMLSTHSLGGVSDKDLELAKQIEAVVNRYQFT